MERLLLFVVFLLASCVAPSSRVATSLPTVAGQSTPNPNSLALPTPTSTADPIACADLDTAWGTADWASALKVVGRLQAAGLTCGEDTLDGKRYAVHINYAVALENAGATTAAIEQYQAAFALNGRGPEALAALTRLDALPPPTEPACSPGQLAPYVPASRNFVLADGNHLVDGNSPFLIRGINYYPRHAPWERFLTEGNLDEMTQELDLLSSAGFNTLRIFLWYDPLFTCAPETATPNPETFAKLDAFMGLATLYDFRLIVTLNDLPDLLFRPLYSDYARYDAQTAFIVNRYRDEPGILAWDLRNEGDIDYGAHPSFPKRFERDVVLAWLAHAAEIVRASDSRHLITAGWWGDALETAQVVDVLSFHHWSGPVELSAKIALLKAISDKPILLEEIGYPSTGDRDEVDQATALKEALETANQSNIAGWMIWTAFDFVPAVGQPPNIEQSFGLWRNDLSPKPALDSLP